MASESSVEKLDQLKRNNHISLLSILYPNSKQSFTTHIWWKILYFYKLVYSSKTTSNIYSMRLYEMILTCLFRDLDIAF